MGGWWIIRDAVELRPKGPTDPFTRGKFDIANPVRVELPGIGKHRPAVLSFPQIASNLGKVVVVFADAARDDAPFDLR